MQTEWHAICPSFTSQFKALATTEKIGKSYPTDPNMTVSVNRVIMQLPIRSGTLSFGMRNDSHDMTKKIVLGEYA